MRKVCETKARKPKYASKTNENITISARVHDIIMQLSIWESTILTITGSTFRGCRNHRKVRIQTTRDEANVYRQSHKINCCTFTSWVMFIFLCSRRKKHPTVTARDKKMMMLSVISLYFGNYYAPPWLDSSTFFPGTFFPSSNINQQALFPEIRNSLSKRKHSNTCTSKKPARMWVKNQAIRQSSSRLQALAHIYSYSVCLQV